MNAGTRAEGCQSILEKPSTDGKYQGRIKLRKKSISIVTTIALLVLAGCAQLSPPKPLAADQAQRLQGRTMATINAETPSFVAMTAAKGGLALIGALAAISEGNNLVKVNRIEDPALKIAEALSASLSEKYRLERNPPAGSAVGDSIEKIVAAAPNADVIMDVRTLGWQFGYFPANWGTYYVAYAAKARLVDVKTKAVIAESTCATPKPEKTDKSPGYDALMNDGARGLKEELAVIANQCIRTLMQDMQL